MYTGATWGEQGAILQRQRSTHDIYTSEFSDLFRYVIRHWPCHVYSPVVMYACPIPPPHVYMVISCHVYSPVVVISCSCADACPIPPPMYTWSSHDMCTLQSATCRSLATPPWLQLSDAILRHLPPPSLCGGVGCPLQCSNRPQGEMGDMCGGVRATRWVICVAVFQQAAGSGLAGWGHSRMSCKGSSIWIMHRDALCHYALAHHMLQ